MITKVEEGSKETLRTIIVFLFFCLHYYSNYVCVREKTECVYLFFPHVIRAIVINGINNKKTYNKEHSKHSSESSYIFFNELIAPGICADYIYRHFQLFSVNDL